MFIEPLRSSSALRQEGHVDVAKLLLARTEQCVDVQSFYISGLTWPSWRRARNTTTRNYKHVPPDGGPAVQTVDPVELTL